MFVTGDYLLDAKPEVVWPHIFQPESLMRLIPGCKTVELVALDEYRTVIDIGLPAIVGKYEATVKLSNYIEPSSCHFDGLVEGTTGRIRGTASFSLQEVDSGKTFVQYEGRAVIEGPLGRLKDRFIQGVAKTLINQGFSKLNKELVKGSE